MPDLRESQRQLGALREAREKARAEFRRGTLELRKLDAQITAAERGQRNPNDPARNNDEGLQRLRQQREQATVELDARKDALQSTRDRAREFGDEFFRADPEVLIRQFDDRVPFLLLPLQIETKFDASDLLVRVFPDEIAIASHEEGLTTAEQSAGQAYWRARSVANGKPTGQDRQTANRGAWNTLAGRTGTQRAGWIARATKPGAWSDRSTDPESLDFPTLELKPEAASDVPRSFVMPDRFAVVLISGERRETFLGALIPDDLPMGPDPLQVENSFARNDAGDRRIAISGETRWLTDFEMAVSQGMALRIRLPAPFNDAPIEKLLVLGIRAAENAASGAQQLARLLEAHRYGDGLGILAQGTPTNNTDDAASGFTTGDSVIDETFALEAQAAGLEETAEDADQLDIQRLAEALSIPFGTLTPLPGATLTDVADGKAMNRALWAGTMGGFLRDMLEPLLGLPEIDRLGEFFSQFVLGRGVLPAIRVGNQPYGVLATSALSRWEWTEAERGTATPFWDRLLGEIRKLESAWSGLQQEQVSYVGKPGKPFDHLMSIVGLQASSVEFYSRKAVTSEYLAKYIQLAHTEGSYSTALWEQLEAARTNNLYNLGLNPAAPYNLKELVFWREQDQLTGPVIDGDPARPLSETERLRNYDDAHNYIDWLTLSTRKRIEAEEFLGADGSRVAAPEALLFRLLRHSYLAELGHAGERFARARVAEFAELPVAPLIANIGTHKSLLQSDLLEIDLAKADIVAQPVSAGDYLVAQSRLRASLLDVAAEAVPLAGMTRALARLSQMSTSALERAIGEHLDVCSHRLDAWIQALFAKRLAQMPAARAAQRGIYLGACGWVENLSPKPGNRVEVPRHQLPASLQTDIDGPLIELKDAGGYIHAPSLTHAVTAAVLRNGHISHANAPDAETFAVNLSSSRVRAAQSLLDGLRNGQDLAALLGYQLERGLHEAHLGTELDEFIYVLRERFPLLSKKASAVADGQTAEQIEARNVINGYDLLEYLRQKRAAGEAFPFGITGLVIDSKGLSVAPVRRDAVAQEFDRLADSLDALGDLMISESVHQVVQGNYDRARGALQSVTEGESPPEPEVIQTPRSGRVLNFRVALQIDPTTTAGWHVPLSPRASLNAPLNHWLASVLPPAAHIQCTITDRAATPVIVTATDLELEPLDFVLMCGERCGDLSSELERFMEFSFRTGNAVPDSVRATADPAARDVDQQLLVDCASAQAGRHSFASLWPLLKALRRVVGQTRALHANDYRLSIEAQISDPANPRGYDDVDGLQAAVATAHAQLKALVDVLSAFVATLELPHEAMLASHTVDPAWNGRMSTLRGHLIGICRFGIPEALPANATTVDEVSIDALVVQARALVTALPKQIDRCAELLATAFTDPLPADASEAARVQGHRLEVRVDNYREAAQCLMGKSLRILPSFRIDAPARAACDAALAAPIEPDAGAVERWLQPLARVREPLAAFNRVAMYHEWLHGGTLALDPLQLPVRSGDAWIGGAFAKSLGAGDVLSLLLANPPANAAARQCGVMIDEWSEVVPTDRETTGIAFQANRPNAQPAQALLLALAPQLRGSWQWDDLIAIVLDTLERAKLRAVEPDMLVPTRYFQMLPANVQEFSRYLIAATQWTESAAMRMEKP